jgi:hypothetical protein
MINGSERAPPTAQTPHYLEEPVTRGELKPFIDQINTVVKDHAVVQSTMEGVLETLAEMRDDMKKLVVHDALRSWVIKVLTGCGGTAGTIILTMVTGHLTGFWKMLGKVMS